MAGELDDLTNRLIEMMATGPERSPSFRHQFRETFRPEERRAELDFLYDPRGEVSLGTPAVEDDQVENALVDFVGERPNLPPEWEGKSEEQLVRAPEEVRETAEQQVEWDERNGILQRYRMMKAQKLSGTKKIDWVRKHVAEPFINMDPSLPRFNETLVALNDSITEEESKVKRAELLQSSKEEFNRVSTALATASQMKDPTMIRKAASDYAAYITKFKDAGVIPPEARYEDLPGILGKAKSEIEEIFGRRRAEKETTKFLGEPVAKGMPERGFFHEQARASLSPEQQAIADPVTGETGLDRAASNLEAQFAERQGRDLGFRSPNPMTEFQAEKTRAEKKREAEMAQRRESLSGLVSSYGNVKLQPKEAAQASMFGRRYMESGNPTELMGLQSMLDDTGRKKERNLEAMNRALDLIRSIGGSGPA